ncbi:MAG: hypothetical protein J6R36_00025 [Bacteroidaceae bacterium]|nr:hypothetical protein [Bacteroidaceae bacterium]
MKNFLMAVAVIACTAMCLFSCTSKDQLKIAVEVAAADCPEDLGDGITMKDILLENGDVVYICEMDEEYYDIEGCNDPLIQASMKAAIMEFIYNNEDASIDEFINIVKESEADIIYRCVGNVSGDGFDIVIDNSEL